MKAKFGSVEVEGDPAEIAALIAAMQCAPAAKVVVSDAVIPKHDFVSAEVAFKALKRRPLSPGQTTVIRTLNANSPGWTTARELQQVTSYNGNQLGGLFGAFGKRLALTPGYRNGSVFFDFVWNYDDDCWQYRLPETVRSAIARAQL